MRSNQHKLQGMAEELGLDTQTLLNYLLQAYVDLDFSLTYRLLEGRISRGELSTDDLSRLKFFYIYLGNILRGNNLI